MRTKHNLNLDQALRDLESYLRSLNNSINLSGFDRNQIAFCFDNLIVIKNHLRAMSNLDIVQDFKDFCEQNLIFDETLQCGIGLLYMRYLVKTDGKLGKKQFINKLLKYFPQLSKTRNEELRKIKGVGLR